MISERGAGDWPVVVYDSFTWHEAREVVTFFRRKLSGGKVENRRVATRRPSEIWRTTQ